jgi:uncharacterized OB-fold protein
VARPAPRDAHLTVRQIEEVRMAETAVPAVEGWFTTGDEPRLLGTRCPTCGTVSFPAATGLCRNPDCRGRELVPAELSRTGTVWSYTDAQYQPPPPYIPRGEEHVPFALAAVELADEQIVILGQVADGFGVDDLEVGAPVELVLEPLYEVDGVDHLIYRWRPC